MAFVLAADVLVSSVAGELVLVLEEALPVGAWLVILLV